MLEARENSHHNEAEASHIKKYIFKYALKADAVHLCTAFKTIIECPPAGSDIAELRARQQHQPITEIEALLEALEARSESTFDEEIFLLSCIEHGVHIENASDRLRPNIDLISSEHQPLFYDGLQRPITLLINGPSGLELLLLDRFPPSLRSSASRMANSIRLSPSLICIEEINHLNAWQLKALKENQRRFDRHIMRICKIASTKLEKTALNRCKGRLGLELCELIGHLGTQHPAWVLECPGEKNSSIFCFNISRPGVPWIEELNGHEAAIFINHRQREDLFILSYTKGDGFILKSTTYRTNDLRRHAANLHVSEEILRTLLEILASRLNRIYGEVITVAIISDSTDTFAYLYQHHYLSLCKLDEPKSIPYIGLPTTSMSLTSIKENSTVAVARVIDRRQINFLHGNSRDELFPEIFTNIDTLKANLYLSENFPPCVIAICEDVGQKYIYCWCLDNGHWKVIPSFPRPLSVAAHLLDPSGLAGWVQEQSPASMQPAPNTPNIIAYIISESAYLNTTEICISADRLSSAIHDADNNSSSGRESHREESTRLTDDEAVDLLSPEIPEPKSPEPTRLYDCQRSDMQYRQLIAARIDPKSVQLVIQVGRSHYLHFQTSKISAFDSTTLISIAESHDPLEVRSVWSSSGSHYLYYHSNFENYLQDSSSPAKKVCASYHGRNLAACITSDNLLHLAYGANSFIHIATRLQFKDA
ncbi:hypothetical protein EII12_06065 [Buchananella hordeovulneris]|uniref:hypothetical protein n=1 Tax=Buchananella hordeovulneris TaxID=52770 RepID=UPI000F5F2B36|nr:hypothetical protein [Buchananella hordeovulneris]RRD52108.1 hypothetical protein EII12_06065 [Buchananella hordeovulneris]